MNPKLKKILLFGGILLLGCCLISAALLFLVPTDDNTETQQSTRAVQEVAAESTDQENDEPAATDSPARQAATATENSSPTSPATATSTAAPTRTTRPTNTPRPTRTATPRPTNTAQPTAMPSLDAALDAISTAPITAENTRYVQELFYQITLFGMNEVSTHDIIRDSTISGEEAPILASTIDQALGALEEISSLEASSDLRSVHQFAVSSLSPCADLLEPLDEILTSGGGDLVFNNEPCHESLIAVLDVVDAYQERNPSMVLESAGEPAATTLPGEIAIVTGIIDGDTIVVSMDGTSYRVRYIGIDTPETGDVCGSDATRANVALVDGQTVRMVKDVSETDRYDRLLRYVYLEDGTFVNGELVAGGWAEAVDYPPDTAMSGVLHDLEAQGSGRGCALVAAPLPTAPPRVATVPAAPPAAPPISPTTAPPAPQPTAAPSGNCDPSYPGVCIPPAPPDLDCGDVPYRRFQVLPPDPHNFDGDGDGIGCESG